MRKWGQHFLTSEAVQKKIVKACELCGDDEVLEIGPGRGELTRHYIEKSSRVVLVEIDPGLSQKLDKRWGSLAHVSILNADFRKLDLDSLGFSRNPVVLSDLPYNVSKPILRKILEWGKYDRAVLMFQKEVALRLAAGYGQPHYGALSLITHLYAAPEKLFHVPPSAFHPPPKVDSTVLRLRPAAFGSAGPQRDRLIRLIRASFAQARKTLANNLCRAFPCFSKQEMEELFKSLGLCTTMRAHEAELPHFQMLARYLLDEPNIKERKNFDDPQDPLL